VARRLAGPAIFACCSVSLSSPPELSSLVTVKSTAVPAVVRKVPAIAVRRPRRTRPRAPPPTRYVRLMSVPSLGRAPFTPSPNTTVAKLFASISTR
jgi:hypothetical protein